MSSNPRIIPLKELAISKKRLNELLQWFQTSTTNECNVLILSGSPGCGKTTTIQSICSHLSLDLIVYDMNFDSTEPDDCDRKSYRDVIGDASKFLWQVSRYQDLISPSRNQCILIDNVSEVEICVKSDAQLMTVINPASKGKRKKQHSSSAINICKSSKGDLRCALNSISLQTTLSTKDTDSSIFQSVGAILHRKIMSSNENENHNLDDILSRCPLSHLNLILFMHHNYLTFVKSIQNLSMIASSFALYDFMQATGWVGSHGNNDVDSTIFAEFAVRTYLNNDDRHRTGFQPIRKPEFDFDKHAPTNMRMINSGLVNKNEIIVDVAPVLETINKGHEELSGALSDHCTFYVNDADVWIDDD
ncbi:hypothetical protein ACOME3_006933 [Neoechinorhynchus agilis]